ncbi:MAG TPA: hypothetical protein VFF25_00780, partial [Clostridia bacterium]|nr:hypothetical protein [Clostridia bacterium]
IQHKKVKVIDDFEANADYKHFKEAHPLATIVVPIQIKGETTGGLCIWKSRIPYSETFNFRTLQLVNYVGRVIGSVIEGCGYASVCES